MPSPPILVISCDRYADLWPVFLKVFQTQWPDCPYELCIGSNFLQAPDGARTVAIGEDVNWADGVQRMLDAISESHVIVMLEDFLLTERVDTGSIERLVDIAYKEDIDCLRLSPLPEPSPLPTQAVSRYPDLGVVESGTLYRVSAQPAIWSVSALRGYLIAGFTPWEFELLGTQLSEHRSHTFWGPFQPRLHYFHAVEKGRWTPRGVDLCQSLGILPDLEARPAFTSAELETHLTRDPISHLVAEEQRSAIDGFSRGQRRVGMQHAISALKLRPTKLSLWGMLAAGMVGPPALHWLRARHLAYRVASITRRRGTTSPARGETSRFRPIPTS
jgi:hypothetical protein